MGEFYQTFKRDPLLGPTITTSPGCAAAPALAVGGALLGDHGAADRELPRCSDPAADHPPLGPEPPPAGPTDAEAPPRTLAALRDVPSAAVIAGGRRPSSPQWTSARAARGHGALRPRGRRGRARLDDPSCDRRLLANQRDRAVDSPVPRAWRAAAIPTRFRPAISPTSSWSATWPAWADGPPSRRSTSTSRPTRPSAAWPAFALVGWHKAMGAGPATFARGGDGDNQIFVIDPDGGAS